MIYDQNNVTSITDARGITATIAYDELERPFSKSYPNTIPGRVEDVQYDYNNCLHSIGRLCQRIDESGTWDYQYDAFGNVTQITRNQLGQNYLTKYKYDEGNHITLMTYPDGRDDSYTRDGLRRIQSIDTTVNGISGSIVSNIQYQVDNKMTQCTFGNGLIDNRSYDLQGRLTNQSPGLLDDRGYNYDLNSNMLSRNTTPQSSNYSYDALDRIIGDQIDTADTFMYQYWSRHLSLCDQCRDQY